MRIITKNKIAYLNYEIMDTYVAGIILKGFEVKSIKSGNINIKDSIIKIQNSELWISNMDIPLYKFTAPAIVPGYEAKGKRKLLMNKKEIGKLAERTTKTGFVMIALKVFETNKRLIKIEIGLGKLKRKIEKKQVIKDRDNKRLADREIKNFKIN